MSAPTPGRPYVLGYTNDELSRLIEQARFFGDLTEQVFLRAGLRPGMHVLDVGCGAGDVSFLAAAIVGPEGSVLGIDRSEEAVALARERAAAAGLEHVRFAAGDLQDLRLETQFDALVGRLVLLYLPEPAKALARLAAHVRPGGLVIFQEMNMSGTRSVPEAPLYDACCERIRETFCRGGVEVDMGARLYPVFREAGLEPPQMIQGARIEGAPALEGSAYVARTVRSLLPMMERLAVPGAKEIEIDTLADRLGAELAKGGGVITLPPLVGAWARKPS